MANSLTAEKKAGFAHSRFVPFSVAGIVCFTVALLLGAGSWYLFGTNRRLSPEKNTVAVQSSSQNPVVENSNLAENSAPVPIAATSIETKKAPAGEISVAGGEVTLGGDDKLPLRRVAVEPFAVAETETTNRQYAEFIKETKHKAPNGWKNDEFPVSAADEPIAGVTWADANAYCEWLSKKLGATVRLPSEAEWELAARGSTDNKYPWGDAWNDEAAASLETKGRVRPVKSFPQGRSPSGAYEMIGNVWEWTGDLFADEFGNPVLYEKTKQRVIKGGSAQEKRDTYLFVKARRGTPETLKFNLLGFRYVIIRQ